MYSKILIYIRHVHKLVVRIPNSDLNKQTRTTTPFIHLSLKEQVLFAKRLSFLIMAGVTVYESICMLRDQTKSKRKRDLFDTIAHDVSAGQYLSTSLEKYGNLFGEFTINIIRAGEHTGMLSENLTYLAHELSKRHALRRKIQSALIYPVFICIATLGVTGLLVVYIFPKIMPIFISLNITLPLTTRTLLSVSEYLREWWLFTLLGTVLMLGLFLTMRRFLISFRTATDWLILKLPIIGGVACTYNCANFCRTLGLNINAGINLVEAIRITAHATQDSIYKIAYLNIAQHSMGGEKISTTLMHYPNLFPDILPHMILIGETTGNLTQTLQYLSELYEAEIDESTKNLSNTIEPFLLMTMGILVGLIAVSIISPIYEVTHHLSNIH